MIALVKAFGLSEVSEATEALIGRLMKRRAVKEGHVARLPGNGKAWCSKP